jgi:hypothetical protein
MNLRNIVTLATAAAALAVIVPASAQTVRFAQFELTDPTALPFVYSGGGVGASITTVPSAIDTDLVFRAGAGALNGVQLNATMTFSVTNGVASFNNGGSDIQDFDLADITFTSTAADVADGIAVGTNLLTMHAVSPDGAISMTGVEGTSVPSLGASSSNPTFLTLVTFSSAVDSLANGTRSGNAFNVAFQNATPGFSVPTTDAALPFVANDAGNFSAPVPELGSVVAFGGMLLGGGLLGFRRRRA